VEISEKIHAAKMLPDAPFGLRVLIIFFFFGATMCLLTVAGLLFPGSVLEPMWRLNPDAHAAFLSLGRWSILLMIFVGTACASAAVGLARRKRWGWQIAIMVLATNLLGDAINAIARHDWRTLIGLPVGGALIFYLGSKRVREFFGADRLAIKAAKSNPNPGNCRRQS
jgi:hypothetical protein